MAISKNKTDIIDKIILKELESELKNIYHQYLLYDYLDYEHDDYYEHDDSFYATDLISSTYISKRFGKVSYINYSFGKKINMESVYSKQNLRQMKLEAILEGKKLPGEKVYLIDNLSQESLDNLKKIS